MIVRRCIDCKNMKYILKDTGKCPTCIGNELTDLEKNVLHYIHKSNGDTTNVTKLKSVLSEKNIGSNIYQSEMYDKYDIIDINKKTTYRGGNKTQLTLNDDIPVYQILKNHID